MDASGTGAATATVNGALPNLVKYALGLPAAATHHEGKLQLGHGADSGGSYLTFSFTHPEPPPPGVAYSVEASGTLAEDSWDTASVQLLDSTVQEGLRTVTVRVDPPPGSEKVFARLKVSSQP